MIHYPKGVSPSFKKRANEAAFWEAWTGAVLARAGLYTIHHPFAADGGDNHGLSWDLDVTSRIDSDWVKTECKGLSLTFTVPEDYPFDYSLICSANSWNRKWPGATSVQRHFLLISTQTGAVLWVPVGTPATVTEVTDTTRGEKYKAMRCESKYLKPLYDFIEAVKA